MKKIFTPFYNKIVGSLTKKGNKISAKRILDNSLTQVSKKIRYPIHNILKDIQSKLHCKVEIRRIKIRSNVHMVPFPLSLTRENYLKVK